MRSILPAKTKQLLKPAKIWIFEKLFGYDYQADGLMSTGHNLEFLEDDKFRNAWDNAVRLNKNCWGSSSVPDVRWRAHVACWAALNAKYLNADFVECGVHTGLLSHTICHFLDFEFINNNFWLFDTFEGIPLETISNDEEKSFANKFNNLYYFDSYEKAKDSFSKYKNVQLVKGIVPNSFSKVKIKKVGYLSIDMNNSNAEVATLEYFWDLLVPGAIVVLDDYGHNVHKIQKEAIDNFCMLKNIMPLNLPTGQALLIKNELFIK